MFVFIDESGIHRPVGFSSFVFVYIEESAYSNIEALVQETECSLRIAHFHWAEVAWPVKEKFIRKVLGLDFKVKVAVLLNPVHPEKEMQYLLARFLTEQTIQSIFIDGKKPRWYGRKLKKALRDKGISVKMLKMVRDSNYAGIRIADMAAGLIRWYFEGKHPSTVTPYFKLLQKKIIILVK